MKVTEYILGYLKEKGINHAFLVTGGAITFLVDSFDENKNMKYICTTHEQGASMASEAYSRITKNIGLAMATSGAGATNLITGIACAYFDSIPVLYITGQVNTKESTCENGARQIGFQETDIISIVKPITKLAVKIINPLDIRYYLDMAIHIAKTGRPGSVLLDIPMNVQQAEIEVDKLRRYIPDEKKIDTESLDKKVDEMINLINNSERPIVIVGAGIKLGNAEVKLRSFLEKLNIPVVATWGGIDILPHSHHLFVEGFGVSANRAGNFAVQTSDLLISLGARLDTREIGGKPETFARYAKKIVLDIDNAELNKGRGLKVDIALNYDIDDFLNVINKKLDKIKLKDISQWKDKISLWKAKYPICRKEYYLQKEKVNPYCFFEILSRESREGDIIIGDTGQNLSWLMQGFAIKEKQRLFSAFGHSPMGYSICASIGASVAENSREIICIIGDGGLKMNINELETIVRYNLPIKIFVINNHEYGLIKQFQDIWMKSSYKASCYEGGLGNPDFTKIASSYGIKTIEINNNHEIEEKVKEVLNFKGAVLCNVEIKSSEKVIPKLEWGNPIEDSSPLLERTEFGENMSISGNCIDYGEKIHDDW